MITEPIGLYVHIPLCVKKCNYCDFCSFESAGAVWREEYINKLCDEIESYEGSGLRVDTVFFGGGTPSLLSSDEFYKITRQINRVFSLSRDTEFTVEANPKTLTEEKLSSFLSSGVNRISMGVQSFDENQLKKLGRIHDSVDALCSYEMIRKAGIDNVNIDLMYGIPDQTTKSFSKTLDTALALSPEHISLYGLILEEGTPFWNSKAELNLPNEDDECDMYYTALEKLKSKGYAHYEISNYAKSGFECKHNLKYWRDEEYVGVGVSAYSYLGGVRFGNSSDISEYLSSKRKEYKYEEKIGLDDNAYEYAMLRLRLAEGFSLTEYKNKFGCDFLTEARKHKLKDFLSLGYLEFSGDRIRLTDKGFYISNAILTELL